MSEKEQFPTIDSMFECAKACGTKAAEGIVLLEGPYSDHLDDAFLRKVLVDRGPDAQDSGHTPEEAVDQNAEKYGLAVQDSWEGR